MLALPIFPARLQASIFGAGELNFRVRDGNGWTLTAINTDCCILTDFSAKIKSFIRFLSQKLFSVFSLVTRTGIEPMFAA